jgi:hypothetical protein
MPLLFTRGPSTQLLLIPSFAKNAKDGAPDPLRQGKKGSPLLLSDAKGREDQMQNVVGGGFAGERVEMTKGSV